jgi:putative flippase GtrA
MIPVDRLSKLIIASADELRSLFMRHQFFRYVLVGIGNTAFSYGVYAAFLLVGFEYRGANLLALLIGIAFSFTTHGNLVFRNATPRTLLKFVLAWTLIYIFNISVIAMLMRAPMSDYLAGAIATIPVTLVSYFILKFAVFGRREQT